MTPDHSQRNYQRMRVTVMGLGSFGGGLGVVKFFLARGATVTVTDLRSRELVAESLGELALHPSVNLTCDGHDENDFLQADLIVVNPAVRRDHPILQMANSCGVPLTSEMNLFWQWNPAPVIAVTGSNGKSTTTALTHSILKQTGKRCWLGGNIGVSLLPHVAEISKEDLVVLELSSFQLTDLNRLKVSPHVSVVTNFSPNHLDWHGTTDEYRSAKQTILRWQNDVDAAVLNADDHDVASWPTLGDRLEFGFCEPGNRGVYGEGEQAIVRIGAAHQSLPLSKWLKLPGRHNYANALAATCASLSCGATMDDVRHGLETYEPLPHRLQFVGEVSGRRFYNDSLATTPESAEVALEAFDSPIILLAGGYDKKVDLSGFASSIAKRTKAVALMGQTADSLRELIDGVAGKKCNCSDSLVSFREAFEWAVEQSSPDDIVLLSPGCASYDWFRNFADRGEQFAELVADFASHRP